MATMQALLLTSLLLASGAAAQEPAVGEDHPVHLDRTGIEWVLPFEAAQAKSRSLGLPLLTKAVAFGTTKEGCW